MMSMMSITADGSDRCEALLDCGVVDEPEPHGPSVVCPAYKPLHVEVYMTSQPGTKST